MYAAGLPRLLPLALTLTFLAGACTEQPRPNILIITVDTLRADFLGFYGDRRAETPNLDALAASSTVFERAAAPMPITRPSHFSMLTSKYPRELGVLNNSTALPDSALTLAEILQPAGYATAAFVGVSLLNRSSGVAQGFERFNAPSASRRLRPARQVVTKALAWLTGRPADSRFFLWVHLFDPHMPYAPPAEFRPPAGGELADVDWKRLESIAAANNGDIPISVLEQTKALYRGEIASTDYWIGRLLEGVAQSSDLDETLVIFTADHGECFENGIYFDHAHCLFEPAMRIPLLVRFPRQFTAGARVDHQVSIVDIVPTVLTASKIEIEQTLSGRPLQEASDFGDRVVLIQHAFYTQELIEHFGDSDVEIETVGGEPLADRIPDAKRYGVVGGGWKYIQGADSVQLFAIAPGASETDNLAATHREVRHFMQARLQEMLRRHPSRDLAPVEVDDELRETLEALGYLD